MLTILLNKIIALLNNAINFLKSNVTVTNIFTMFLQTIKIENSYLFAHLHQFLLINDHSLH